MRQSHQYVNSIKFPQTAKLLEELFPRTDKTIKFVLDLPITKRVFPKPEDEK